MERHGAEGDGAGAASRPGIPGGRATDTVRPKSEDQGEEGQGGREDGEDGRICSRKRLTGSAPRPGARWAAAPTWRTGGVRVCAVCAGWRTAPPWPRTRGRCPNGCGRARHAGWTGRTRRRSRPPPRACAPPGWPGSRGRARPRRVCDRAETGVRGVRGPFPHRVRPHGPDRARTPRTPAHRRSAHQRRRALQWWMRCSCSAIS